MGNRYFYLHTKGDNHIVNRLDNVIDFMKSYTYYNDRALKEKLLGHLEYKTCKILLDKDGKVCGVCCWNISADGLIADITDIILREDFRGRDMMRKMLEGELKIWNVKYLRYVRDYNADGHDRGPKRTIRVDRFLRRKA